jgi:hypothetical protein
MERKIFTWLHDSPTDHVNSDAKLCGGNCIQYARDPFVLPRYRIGSARVRVSEPILADEETSNLWVRKIWANTEINVKYRTSMNEVLLHLRCQGQPCKFRVRR